MASTSDLARLLIIASLLCWLGACRTKNAEPRPNESETGAPVVVAVNYPVAYFAGRVAPEGTNVELPVPEGIDPAFWRPTPEAISEVQGATLILLNGAGYAGWTEHATLPRSRTVVTTKGCRKSFLPSGERLRHQHGPEGEHAHGDTAFTTWLDFGLARCQAANIRDALTALLPDEKASIEERFEKLDAELRALDASARTAANAWGERPLLASHPVYQYLADAYGLRIESLHFEPEQELDDSALRTLDAALAKSSATLMLWEGTPLTSTRSALETRDIEIVVFDPAGNVPTEGDWLDVMRENTSRLACATGASSCD